MNDIRERIRRAARGLRPQFQDLSPKEFGRKVLVTVFEAEQLGGSGGQKRRYAVRKLVDFLDEHHTWGEGPLAHVLELLDGKAVRAGAMLAIEAGVAAIDIIPIPVLELLAEEGLEQAVALAARMGEKVAEAAPVNAAVGLG